MKHEQKEIRLPNSREAYKNGTTKVRVFRELPETTLQRVERVEGLRKTKQEKLRRKDGDKSRMSRVTRGVEQQSNNY